DGDRAGARYRHADSVQEPGGGRRRPHRQCGRRLRKVRWLGHRHAAADDCRRLRHRDDARRGEREGRVPRRRNLSRRADFGRCALSARGAAAAHRRSQARNRDRPDDGRGDGVGVVLRLRRHGRGPGAADGRRARRRRDLRRDRRPRGRDCPRDAADPARRQGSDPRRAPHRLGTQSPTALTVSLDIADYCREIETYLCRKNDGHLIRVVGPSFDLVSAWAARGVPLKIAYAGIDRYCERYYRKGPRRRPVKIDFCEADVLDVYDEWRKAVGITSAGRAGEAGGAGEAGPAGRAGRSLPAHLERVILKLSQARASGRLGDQFDALIDRVNAELEIARASAGGVRGEARQQLLARLEALDAELLRGAREGLSDETLGALSSEAAEELTSFRERMNAEAFALALDRALLRLIRERFGLPTVGLTSG